MKDEETITKYCYDLELENDAIIKSIEIYNVSRALLKKQRCKSCGKIINRRLPEKKTIMVSSIYIASILTGQPISQEVIAQSLDVTQPTLRKQYRKIMTLPKYKNEDKITIMSWCHR